MISNKKTIFGMLAGLVLWATAAAATPVSVDTARQAALNWMAGRTREVLAETAVVDVTVESEDDMPVYYVFNFIPSGWVMVAADDVAYPVIGYALQGTYAQEGQPPPFQAWMQRVGQGIAAAVSARVAAGTRTASAWQELSATGGFVRRAPLEAPSAVDPPLLSTTWNQNEYYNAACPEDDEGPDGHAYGGCVATAMAQVMKFHAYPDTGLGSHGYQHDESQDPPYENDYGWLWADFGATHYDWPAMPNAINTYNNPIANLIYQCGVSVDMNFGPTGSSANMSIDALNALKNHFRYEDSIYYVAKKNSITGQVNYTTEEWMALLKAELNAGRPMLYAGPGHVFICDGYDEDDLFHFNWGWGGTYNDTFLSLDALTPGGGYNFTNGQGALVGIRPSLLPAVDLPYSEGFEAGIPVSWIVAGERVSVSTAEARSGSSSLLLGDRTSNDNSIHTAVLKIEIPANGAELSFWVKRGHSAPSGFNRQSAWIKPAFGPQHHLAMFDDDAADDDWQEFRVDLTSWADTTVRIYFQQDKSYTTPASTQWMHIDDVALNPSQAPLADFSSDAAANCGGQIAFQDRSTHFPTAWQWSFPGGEPSTSSISNPTVTYDTPGLYNVSLTVSNLAGVGTTEIKSAYIGVYDEPPSPCEPKVPDDNNYRIGITNVTFGTIDSTSEGTVLDGGYRNFVCSRTTRLLPDTDYSLSVTVGESNFEDVSVFIDYNNDGNFDDDDEHVLFLNEFKQQNTGVLHTPSEPVFDRLLRMRVISDLSGIPIAGDCTEPQYGQAEDYGVVFPSVWPSNDQRGDVNGDGGVDLADALIGLQFLALMPVTTDINRMADVDGDGCIGPAEIAYILWICAGSPP